MLNESVSSDDPLYTDRLKFALYRSATADALGRILGQTQEPWPRGYEVLAEMADQSSRRRACSNGEHSTRSPGDRATVSQLWEAQAKRAAFSKRMLTAWADTRLKTGTGREMDALLMPTTPWPASRKQVIDAPTHGRGALTILAGTSFLTTTTPACGISSTTARRLFQSRKWSQARTRSQSTRPVVSSRQKSGRTVSLELHAKPLGRLQVADRQS